MIKSEFKITKMDCPSEENLIRVKLNSFNIVQFDFDLEKRHLTLFHQEEIDLIEQALIELKLGSELISSSESDYTPNNNEQSKQRKLLWSILLINFAFFAIEMTTGIFSKSMGLIADSLDMLADASVYALSLIAVGSSTLRKKTIAKSAGYFQILLATLGFAEVLRRFFGYEKIPEFRIMIIISIFALIANAICLFLLQKSKSDEAHIKASMIFTSNDVVINLGVIIAGIMVYCLGSGLPDLIIGSIVFLLVLSGARRILSLAK